MATKRWSLSVPFEGFALPEHADLAREAERLGYTDAWSYEADGLDCFTSLAPVALATRMRLGTAIANVFTRGPATLAMSAAGVADLAPGRFILGLGAGSQPIVESWNGGRFAQPATRVVVRSPEHTPEDFLELVERLGLHGGSYTVGWTAWLDIAPEGVSKAHGLQFVTSSLGVDAADVLAVGDGRNDLEMFAWAGRAVAMGQAPDQVRDAADEVCADVYADGLADVLERLVAEGN